MQSEIWMNLKIMMLKGKPIKERILICVSKAANCFGVALLCVEVCAFSSNCCQMLGVIVIVPVKLFSIV